MPTDMLPKITTGHILSIQGILGIIRWTLKIYIIFKSAFRVLYSTIYYYILHDISLRNVQIVNLEDFSHGVVSISNFKVINQAKLQHMRT